MRKGFTLIEVMIVVSILGILAAVFVGKFGHRTNSASFLIRHDGITETLFSCYMGESCICCETEAGTSKTICGNYSYEKVGR